MQRPQKVDEVLASLADDRPKFHLVVDGPNALGEQNRPLASALFGAFPNVEDRNRP